MKKPVIEFRHFGFKYRSQVSPTLNDINLTIYEGEKVVIVGPSGCGKSTFAHCINGLVPFSYKGELTGELLIMGEDATKHTIFQRSKLVGTVLQDPDSQFIGLTVGEDIAFSLENDCATQREMLRKVDVVSKMVNMQDYQESSLHELSGGQKQRVALAGVMVDDVPILLFDEPLANLDPATGKDAMALIDKIQIETSKTVLIIEHRLEDVLYRSVDRIIVVNHGQIICDASPNVVLSTEILAENDIREPLYVRALKYADCIIKPETNPQNIKDMKINHYQEKLGEWYKSTIPLIKRTERSPVLELDNISFSYKKGKKVLQNISFRLNKGEMVSIVGKNGAGKSTLTKLICGFEKPDSGTIFVNGRDITSDSIKERSLKIGLVMQNPNHMISKHMIYDEVALGLVVRGTPEKEVKERVEKVLKICGLQPFRNWPISALSFGQKKRVTIASILVLEPEILLLDEPTAGQDFRTYTEIMEFLEDLNTLGVTIIMITHDMHLMLEYTPRAIVIANGEKAADDSAVNILTNPQIVQQAYLKETSLFELAVRANIKNPVEFVNRFIDHDKEKRKQWQ